MEENWQISKINKQKKKKKKRRKEKHTPPFFNMATTLELLDAQIKRLEEELHELENSETDDDLEETKEFWCDICEKEYPNIAVLVQHKLGRKHMQQELLKQNWRYEAVGHRPFFCKCCQTQFSEEISFNAHRESEEHKAQEHKERAASYCSLCRKQFTSVIQLEEHTKGKIHRERAQQFSQSKRCSKRKAEQGDIRSSDRTRTRQLSNKTRRKVEKRAETKYCA